MTSRPAAMTNLYLADTHALLWHLFQPTRLSQTAKNAFAEVDANEAILQVPLIVIAEALMIIEKKRVKVTKTQFEKVLQQMAASSNYQIGELNLDIILAAAQLTQLNDIFDRLIVAETQAINAKLISRDEEITTANLIPIIW